MVDPEFFYDGAEALESFDEEYLYDTYDSIIGEEELQNEKIENEAGLSPEEFGTAFAFADEIASEKRAFELADSMADEGKYDMSEKTDKENYKRALSYCKVNRHGELPLFDQIVHDICTGKRSLFDTNY